VAGEKRIGQPKHSKIKKLDEKKKKKSFKIMLIDASPS
jgi:hypothetical protein